MSANGFTTPLIDQCEGADADDRAAVVSAFLRIWRQQPKAKGTDLHVEQFCLAVFAVDRSGAGVQWTYDEIADRLRCGRSTARSIVERASAEFGIVAVKDERYARGGQAANRYSIEWSVVRAINAGMISRRDINRPQITHPAEAPFISAHPGVVSAHPPVVSAHPGALRRQPYKDSPSILPSIQTSTTTTTAAESAECLTGAGCLTGEWVVVVNVLDSLGMSDAPGAARAAHGRGLTPADVSDLVERYAQLTAADPDATVGYLHRWLTGRSKPPEAVPRPTVRSHSTMSDTTRRELIRARIVKAGRRAGRTEAEIDRAVELELAKLATTKPP